MGAKTYFNATFNKGCLWEIFFRDIRPTTSIGTDGISSKKFESILETELDIILRKVSLKSYSFSRYKEKLVNKGFDKYPRQISIPTVRDKLVLKAVHEIVKLTFVEAAPQKPQKIVSNIKQELAEISDQAYFLRIDIQNFYPSVNHHMLMRKLRSKIRTQELLNLILASITTATGNCEPPTIGIPQGLSISNHLSSVFLLNFDKKIQLQCALINAKYYRYVDDIFIIFETGNAEQFFNLVTDLLNEEGLMAHPLQSDQGKSQIVSADEGISYLGYEISTNGLTVKKESLQKMYDNILRVLGALKYGNDKNTRLQLFRLNLKITGCIVNKVKFGWLHFFSEIDKIHQLHQLDNFVRREAKKKLEPNNLKNLKSFVRAFFEIKHNHYDTDYIPNFDSYDIDQKIELISFLTAKKQSEITNWEDDAIELAFQQVLIKETKKLEADVGGY